MWKTVKLDDIINFKETLDQDIEYYTNYINLVIYVLYQLPPSALWREQ